MTSFLDGIRGLTVKDVTVYFSILLLIGLVIYTTVNNAHERSIYDQKSSARITKLVDKNSYLIKKLAIEGEQRRDQTCTIFETQHLQDVNRLKRTYEYLDSLPESEWDKPLTREIVLQLNTVEEQARLDGAPNYCDEPGVKAEAEGQKPVGLPEPDPVLPKKRNYKYLLR